MEKRMYLKFEKSDMTLLTKFELNYIAKGISPVIKQG